MKEIFHTLFVTEKSKTKKFIIATFLIVAVVVFFIAMCYQAWDNNFTFWNWISKSFIWSIIMCCFVFAISLASYIYEDIYG